MEQTVIALCKNKSNKTRCENSYLFLSISFFSFNNLLDINSGRAMYGKRSIARFSDSRLVLVFALSYSVVGVNFLRVAWKVLRLCRQFLNQDKLAPYGQTTIYFTKLFLFL